MKHFPYKVLNKGEKPVVQVEYQGEKKVFSPEEISAMILGKVGTSEGRAATVLATGC